MKLTMPPVGVTLLGGDVVTVAVKTSLWPYVNEPAETARVVLVGLDNKVRSSSSATTGPSRRLGVRPRRGFARVRNVPSDDLVARSARRCQGDMTYSVLTTLSNPCNPIEARR